MYYDSAHDSIILAVRNTTLQLLNSEQTFAIRTPEGFITVIGLTALLKLEIAYLVLTQSWLKAMLHS